jgi:hypothetical protein
MHPSLPMVQGFRLIFRRPAVPLGEIAWRWSFVAATWILGILFAVEYVDTLPVSALDRLLLLTRQPILIARALHRILHGSPLPFTEGAILLGVALAVAWIFLASFGRAATLGSLLDELDVTRSWPPRASFPALVGLNFIRVAVTLAALVGSIGAALIANSFWASSHASGRDATRVFFLSLFLVWLAWYVLNWLLSTAAIPVLSRGGSALTAIASTLQTCQKRIGTVLTTGVFFLLLHMAALGAACGIGFVVLGTLGAFGLAATLFLELVIAIAYCAVADFLYTARMAAYVSIMEDAATQQLAPLAGPPLIPADNLSHIDQSELILSDIPATSS